VTGSPFVFGPDMTFDIKLEWVLDGADPAFKDTASGKLRFALDKLLEPSGRYTRNQTGVVEVLPP
jgi:hypothetical protein